MCYIVDIPKKISEGSLEVKLPTISTDEKVEVGRVREEKRREKRRREEKKRRRKKKEGRRKKKEERSEERKGQKTEDAGARKGSKVAKHCVFPMICGSGGSKSRLAKAAAAGPSGEMR